MKWLRIAGVSAVFLLTTGCGLGSELPSDPDELRSELMRILPEGTQRIQASTVLDSLGFDVRPFNADEGRLTAYVPVRSWNPFVEKNNRAQLTFDEQDVLESITVERVLTSF